MNDDDFSREFTREDDNIVPQYEDEDGTQCSKEQEKEKANDKPNNCTDELTMVGSKRDLDILEAIFRVKNPLKYFHPLPTELFEIIEASEARNPNDAPRIDSADRLYPKWGIWTRQIWEVDWMEVEELKRIDETKLFVRLKTPSIAPREIVYFLGDVFDEIVFDMRFHETIAGFKGRLLIEKGKIAEDTMETWEPEREGDVSEVLPEQEEQATEKRVQRTGLPPKGPHFWWGTEREVCLNCGHTYEGKEMTEFDETFRSGEGPLCACLHCGSARGFKLYNENGEYIYFSTTDEGFVRDRSEIGERLEEFFQRVWYVRHLSFGEPAAGRVAARKHEAIYGKLPADFGDWQYGYWSGQLAALRWVIGDEEHSLDT